MSAPSLILIGAGGHAGACIDVIEQHGQYRIAGLVGLPVEVDIEHFGHRVIATDDDLPELFKAHKFALITLGQIRSPDRRMSLYHQIIALGFQLPIITSANAYVSCHATIGAGTIVMHGAVVNAGARVGNNCIINSHALIEHGATVADHCHVSTGAIVNGDVKVGAGTFIGSGSVIKEGVTLGPRCVIGMGLSVRHDQLEFARFTGNN